MKPVEQIRRERLAILVKEAGSQAALARSIHKDKNQVNQWLGRAGSRNMSAETAREIETLRRKPPNWMDQDVTTETTAAASSHDMGLDLPRMHASIEFLEHQFELWDKLFVASERSTLIAEVYRRKGLEKPPSPVELSQWLAEHLKEDDDAARERVEGTGGHDRRRNQGRAAKA